MAITIAYVVPGEEVPLPKSAENLLELGAVDAGTPTPTTVKGETTTTVKGATTTTVAVATTTTGG